MKSNKEIIEYLSPYLSIEGFCTKRLVMHMRVRGRMCDHLCIWFDIKSSWKGYGGTDTRHLSLKSHLTKNGFRYSENHGCYHRPYHKKDWGLYDSELHCDLGEVYKGEYLRVSY